jgi:uncharacterized protein (TIGR03067 family)
LTPILLATAAILLAGDGTAPDKDLLGTWEQVPASEPRVILIITRDTYAVQIAGQATTPDRYKVDPSRAPRTLDVTRSEGPRKGETVLAIYEVKGDSLRTCFAPPGRERPTGFTPKEGSGHVPRTYKRVKPG